MSVTQATLLGDTFGSQASGTIPVGGIIMWSGTIATIPTGWSLCNGTNGTPNLQDRFIVGAGSGYAVAATGGANSVALTINEMPSHSHGGTTGNDSPNHTHNLNSGFDQYYVINDGNFGGTGPDGSFRAEGPDQPQDARWYSNTGGVNNNHQHGITAEGQNGAHENRPPYYALAFIMRVS
jgi:microcystin-dependent protein